MLQWVYVAAFSLASVGCLYGAARAGELGETTVTRPLVALLVTCGIWGGVTTMQLLAPTVELKIALFTLGLLVGFATVPFWLWFCSAYSGSSYHTDARFQTVAIGGYLFVVTLKLTNPIHGSYFDPVVRETPFRYIDPGFLPLYWMVTLLAYALTVAGFYLLFETFVQSNVSTRGVTLLTAVMAVPAVPTALHATGTDLLLPLYYEPIAAAVFGVGVVSAVDQSFTEIEGAARNEVVQSSTTPVLTVDGDGRLVDYNDGARETFGPFDDPDEFQSSTIGSALCDLDDETLSVAIDGDQRYYAVDRAEVTVGSNAVGTAYTLSDVTELESHRRLLEQQTERMDWMMTAMAHELRNPLTVVRAVLDQAAESDAPAGEVSQARFESAAAGARRIDEAVDDLIAFAGVAKPTLDCRPVSVGDAAAAAWSHAACGESATLAAVDDGSVLANAVQFEQLLAYVFRAHCRRGAASVSLDVDGDSLTIRSDGTPVDISEQKRVFEYSYETDTGMEFLLASALALVNAQGWTLTIAPSDGEFVTTIADVDPAD